MQESDERLASVLDVVQRARRTREPDPIDSLPPGEVIELTPSDRETASEVPEENFTTEASTAIEEVAIHWLPMEQIKVGGINTRVVDEESPDFLQLVDSMRQHGQLDAVWVGQEEGYFRLIAGERRYRAMRILGHTHIIAKIVRAPREEWPVLMLIENLQRKDMSAWEEARGYQVLLDRGMTMREVGQRVGRTEGHVSMVLKIGRNPSIMAALEDGRISSISLAREMGALLNRDGVEIEEGIIGRTLEYIGRWNPTTIQLRQWITVQIAAGLSGSITTKKRKTQHTNRGTFLKSEEQHLAGVRAKIPLLSSKEIEVLASIYEEEAQRLRLMAQGVKTEEN